MVLLSRASALGAVKKHQHAVSLRPAKAPKQVNQGLLVVQVRQGESAQVRNQVVSVYDPLHWRNFTA